MLEVSTSKPLSEIRQDEVQVKKKTFLVNASFECEKAPMKAAMLRAKISETPVTVPV
jgi:hypothetical protein